MTTKQQRAISASVRWLDRDGYDIISVIYETVFGDVIVAKDGESLVFIDVQIVEKKFPNVDTAETLEKLEKIALAFLQDADISSERNEIIVRFEVMQVLQTAEHQALIRHIVAVGNELSEKSNDLNELLAELVANGEITDEAAQRILSVA